MTDHYHSSELYKSLEIAFFRELGRQAALKLTEGREGYSAQLIYLAHHIGHSIQNGHYLSSEVVSDHVRGVTRGFRTGEYPTREPPPSLS